MAGMDESRAFIKSARRVVIKVGTAVVTRDSDGRLAIGRLGALCEQVEALLGEGKEVVLVTSGAVGVGRQKLRFQKTLRSSFADLQKPQGELGGKPCAAIGQSGLMALYDALFGQLDVACSQLLVTDTDFENSDFRAQLRETVDLLLEHRVVPVFNENDAISTRKAPYKDSTGIFWDNDSLASLLSLELQADLLVLLSDVEGLYTGPPSLPSSQLIHTYLKAKHDDMVTFGEGSRVGRGGMVAKVEAAWNAAAAGVPVIIASGYTPNGLLDVMSGRHVGTLFHRDAPLWNHPEATPGGDGGLGGGSGQVAGARDMAVAARTASRNLQALPSETRVATLLAVAAALEANEGAIIAENEEDVRAAEGGGVEEALLQRLRLKPGRIGQLAEGIRSIASMPEPIAQTLLRTELAEGLVVEKQTWPLGVVMVIFEARPDALPQIAALAIRSGNGLLLKGGKEALRSNTILHKVRVNEVIRDTAPLTDLREVRVGVSGLVHDVIATCHASHLATCQVITSALPESVGPALIGHIMSREAIPELLKLDDVVDLVIPRGSNRLVASIKDNTKIAVLGHADGVCHVYVDSSAQMPMALKIVLDAKLDYPAACNALETLLVHQDLHSSGALASLLTAMEQQGIILFGGTVAAPLLHLPPPPALHFEYGYPGCTVEVVGGVEEAIEYIHRHGSSHTDCIVAEDEMVVERFLGAVDSAAVFHNASTRFCDGFRFGLGAEVGISTSRIHARGPVGVEGLLTTRWILRGNGQVVDKDKAIKYTHRKLPLVSE